MSFSGISRVGVRSSFRRSRVSLSPRVLHSNNRVETVATGCKGFSDPQRYHTGLTASRGRMDGVLVMIPTERMGQQQLREVGCLVQGHTASEGRAYSGIPDQTCSLHHPPGRLASKTESPTRSLRLQDPRTSCWHPSATLSRHSCRRTQQNIP